MTKVAATMRVAPWFRSLDTQDANRTVFEGASELIADHGFKVRDSMILAAASASGASVLLSEDMQDGFRWRETVIVNPFALNPSPFVQMLLGNNDL